MKVTYGHKGKALVLKDFKDDKAMFSSLCKLIEKSLSQEKKDLNRNRLVGTLTIGI